MAALPRRLHLLAAIVIMAPAVAVPQSPAPLSSSSRSDAASSAGAREVLDYAIEWRLIPAGAAKLTFLTLPRSSAAATELRLHIESAGLVSRLFRVEDDYTSLQGPNFCAQSTFLVAHEGNRNKETRVIYDPQARRTTWLEKDFTKNATHTQTVEIPPCVHDVLGGLMVLRNLRLETGKTVRLPLSDGKKFVQARVESQRREEVRTDLGTFKTIRYEVFLFDNVLYKRSGHLHVWLTDDERRLPVQLQVRLQFTIGTITFRLVKDEK